MSFEDAHKTKSETKTMFGPAEHNLRQTRDLKSKGLPVVDVGMRRVIQESWSSSGKPTKR